MAAISEPTSGISPEHYSFENPSPKELPTVADQPQMQSGESERLMKAGEDLQRATSPNLRDLDTQEIFPLAMELFKIKVEAFKKSGGSVEDFAAKVSRRMKIDRDFVCSYTNALENDIVKLYATLARLAEMEHRNGTTSNPGLQFFELEKETGFSVFGTFILKKEFDHCLNLIHKASLRNEPLKMERLYWDTVVPTFQKIMSHLEKKHRYSAHSNILENYADILNLCEGHFPISKDGKDPFTQALLHLPDHVPLESLETAFNKRFKNLATWDRSYLWIDLHCQIAELVAPKNQQKAQDLLDQAEEKVSSDLQPLIFNRAAIHQRKQDAERRIAETKIKI